MVIVIGTLTIFLVGLILTKLRVKKTVPSGPETVKFYSIIVKFCIVKGAKT
jgi:hypothetical protein